MFATTTVDVSENESDQEDHYDKRVRRNSRRHTSRLDVKKKRHKLHRRQHSDSNSENQSDNDERYISANFLHVPRDFKHERRRKSAESKIIVKNNNERPKPKSDQYEYDFKGLIVDNSRRMTLSVDNCDSISRRSSNESVLSNHGGVSVYFHPYDSLSEDQTSSRKSTSSSQMQRQNAICYSSSSSILSENLQPNRRRRSNSPSFSNDKRYKSVSCDRSRDSSIDHPDYLPIGQRNQLRVDNTGSGSRRCSDESMKSRRSTQSDASQYYKGMLIIV